MDDEESHVYKDDIDDNCPMTWTGDDDTDHIVDDLIATQLSDGESSVTSGIRRDLKEMLPNNENGKAEVCLDEHSPVHEDEEESFSSDRNCVSDEETSSFGESYDDLGRDDLEDDSASEPISDRRREEKLRLIALRKHLDELGELVVEREHAVHQAKSELQKCREYLQHLEEEMKDISNQMEEAERNGQKARFDALKRNSDKHAAEISMEKEVHSKCVQNLEDAEFYLAQTYIEHGKFLPIYEELEEEEKQNSKQKIVKANARIKKEMANAIAIERRKKSKDKEHISTVRERERKNRQAVIAAKKNREVAMKYLKDTMSRIREKESKEEDKSRSNLNKRMDALLSLKRNIEFNKENMAALQACERHQRKQESSLENSEREKLESMGENPDEVLTRRKRIRQFEQDKEAFERKQREREIEIVNKIISEEKQMKKRHQQQPQLWPGNKPRRVPRRRLKSQFAPSSGSESMEYGADVEDIDSKRSYLNKVSTDEEGELSPYGATNRDEDDDKETTEDDDVEREDDKDLAEPEFKGLWDQDEITASKTSSWKTTTHEYSKYEQEMMKNALLKQKQNIVQKQVAAGREFKGVAFYSKPETVVFKDFDVGKSYHCKVVLTNVSYSQNYCQYIGLTDKLKDFIDISFVSPGPMSAGLTCDLTVTFKPMINEDLEGRIEMMAQTGVFYIQIRCLKKRCDVKVDATELKFEKQVVGETRKKIVTLKNCGALGTSFTFSKVNDCESEFNDSELDDNKVMKNGTGSGENKEIMRTGKLESGTLGPFSATQLEVLYSPLEPGYIQNVFKVEFSSPNVKSIFLTATGTGIELPVWVEKEIVDLRICMYDRLYQDAVLISNRATSALQIRFEIPKELRNHVDILPKTAFIQAESQFSAQLKFLPRKSLSFDAKSFLDNDSGKLEVPVIIHVADQTQPVPFTVTATVTSSDLEFDVGEINFGNCTVYETVSRSIKLVNKSVLPQQFGFVGAPDFIDVQPNDGFGTILPHEKLDIDVMFSPNKAQDYRFKLLCKSEIGREFTVPCRGVGVLPPLKLSENIVKFRATAINDTSSTHLFVINDHTSMNEFTHPVPRIGSGEIFPVGPTSFQFIVPDDAPITISPSVQTLLPGKKAMVHVVFSPKLDQVSISKKLSEVSRCDDETLDELDKSKGGQESKLQQKGPSQAKTKAGGDGGEDSKSKQKTPKGGRKTKSSPPVTDTSTELKNETTKLADCDSLKRAELGLLKSYENSFSKYKIPCCIGNGRCEGTEKIKYNPNYTLYLEVHCPAVRPSLIAVTASGDNMLDFGKVSTGQKVTLLVSLQNISDRTLDLSSKALDPIGPFELVNALRPMEPGAFLSLKVSFCPIESREFYEVLAVLTGSDTVEVRLQGQGIEPKIQLEPDESFFDVGDVLVMDTASAPLKITNVSELPMEFIVNMGSLSPLKHDRLQNISFFTGGSSGTDGFSVGTANRSGVCAFGCKPCQGSLQPGESKELQVSFSPDHVSDLYRDELLIDVNGAEEFLTVHVVGRGWPSMTYARGWDKLSPAQESLVSQMGGATGKTNEDHCNVLLTFHSTLENSEFSPVERIVELGCVRTATQLKKSCDFSVENVKEAKDLGFSIEPLKGGVDIGSKKPLAFLWEPVSNFDPEKVAKTCVQLIMRGDTPVTYNIMLRGFVSSLPSSSR